MGQRKSRRTEKVLVYLEPPIYTAFLMAYEKYMDELSQSEYIRKLVISDLKSKGLLTDSILAEIA